MERQYLHLSQQLVRNRWKPEPTYSLVIVIRAVKNVMTKLASSYLSHKFLLHEVFKSGSPFNMLPQRAK